MRSRFVTKMKNEIINVRGVNFHNVTLDEAAKYLEERYKNGEKTAVFTPNSEIVQLCINDSDFCSVINSAELIIPDGIGVVKAARILKTPLKGKVAGVDFGKKTLEIAAKKGIPVFLFGGKDATRTESGVSVAEQCKTVFEKEFPGINIAGTRDGYCKKEGSDNDKTVEMINSSGAEILFVCLGAPLQENWIYNNRDKMPNVKIFLGLGGSLDVYSGNTKRAPKLFIKLNLEWFYRLLCEPKRIGRMMSLPKFYFGTWKYKFKKK